MTDKSLEPQDDGGPTIDDSLEELRLQADGLRASRARLVAAADAERRRIERELHDGTQQHLVAIAVNVQLARHLADSDLAAAKELLEEIGRDVRQALDAVRELAYGIYPPLLLDRGLAEALRAAAARAGVPTQVEAGALDPFPPDVEATVYFCCIEALQNIEAHAGASGARATVRAWQEEGTLFFEVGDAGAGFEPRAQHPDTDALTGFRDRLGALGGSLDVFTEPGRGTRVRGAIPRAR
jgi:signal transduction histidine kinase